MRALVPLLHIAALASCRPAPAAETNDAARTPPSVVDEAAVKTMSHALLDAEGRGDVDAFAKASAQSFVLFEKGHVRARDELLEGLRAQAKHPGPPRLLTYGTEYVSIGSASAVYMGEAVEHLPPDATGQTAELDGWSTLVWVREDGRWKAASWQWTQGGLDGAREEWNATFRDGTAFTHEPNKFLAEIIRGRKPGTALDVGMGQGRNAVYLASKGWTVTGVDISDEGIRRARETAAAQKLTLETINADIETWDFGVEKWDLVALIYSSCDEKRVAQLRTSLKQGGLVVIDGYHKEKGPGLGYETGELAALFKDGFKVLRDEVVENVADWGRQRQKLTHFAAEKN